MTHQYPAVHPELYALIPWLTYLSACRARATEAESQGDRKGSKHLSSRCVLKVCLCKQIVFPLQWTNLYLSLCLCICCKYMWKTTKTSLILSLCLHDPVQTFHSTTHSPFFLYISIFVSFSSTSSPLHLCSSPSVRDIPRAEAEGRPSPHAVPMSFLSAGRGARRERPDRLPPQPYTGADCGEVRICTNNINTICTVAVRYSQSWYRCLKHVLWCVVISFYDNISSSAH